MWFAALVLRLALMPFTSHTDILFINYYPFFLSHHGIWDIYGYFGNHYVDQGFTYYPPLCYYVVGFFQVFLKPIYGTAFAPFMDRVHEIMYSTRVDLYGKAMGKDIPVGHYYTSLSLPEIWRFNFLMKLPYLAADVLSAFIISRTFEGEAKRKTLLLWLFFPVSIFSSYIFGQYRVLSATCVWAAIHFSRREKPMAAMASLGAAALLDVFPFLLFIPAFFLYAKSRGERIRLTACFLILLALVLIPLAFSSRGLVFYSYTSELIRKTFLQSITNSWYVRIVPIVAKLTLASLLVWIAFLASKVGGNRGALSRSFVYIGLMTLLALYSTTGTMVHYFMWAAPFFIVVLAEGAPWPRALTWVFITCLFLFNLDSRALNLGLLSPLGPEYFMSMPSLHETMERVMPWDKAVACFRGAFSALGFFFIVRLYTERLRPLFSR